MGQGVWRNLKTDGERNGVWVCIIAPEEHGSGDDDRGQTIGSEDEGRNVRTAREGSYLSTTPPLLFFPLCHFFYFHFFQGGTYGWAREMVALVYLA